MSSKKVKVLFSLKFSSLFFSCWVYFFFSLTFILFLSLFFLRFIHSSYFAVIEKNAFNLFFFSLSKERKKKFNSLCLTYTHLDNVYKRASYTCELIVQTENFNICELSTAMTTHSNLSFFANRDIQPTTTTSTTINNDRIKDNDHKISKHQQITEHDFKVNSIIENLHAVCDRATRSGVDNIAMISLLPSTGIFMKI